jgi:Cys-tRNA(Pro)/Cys-tRNA(Cys) deacylase
MAGTETPATAAARAAGITFTVHEYHHEPAAASFGLEAAAALGVAPERVLKTLVVLNGDALVVCIVPAPQMLRLRALGKHASLAPPERAQRATGYVVGGISPLGQRRALPTFLDASALEHLTVFISAGRRGLELELAPADLVALTGAEARPLT